MADKQNNIPISAKRHSTSIVVTCVIVALVEFSLLVVAPAYSGTTPTARESDNTQEIVFAVRQPKGPHWYENMEYAITDVNDKAYSSRGYLCKLNLRTGKVTLLLEDPQGAVRDPQVHYDGKKILFSYRRGGTDYFHLYEINADVSELKQLTDGPFDDIEPTYLPDDGIIFCSTRAKRWVPCWYTQVATLHRCDGDGGNIHMLSARLQMADGRDLARGNYPPYTIGSSASPLMNKFDPSHYNVQPTRHELRMLKLWIDAFATFPGTYAALGTGMIGPYAALQYKTKTEPDYLSWPSIKAAAEVLDRRCASCHSGRMRLPRHPADNLELRLHYLVYGKGTPQVLSKALWKLLFQ